MMTPHDPFINDPFIKNLIDPLEQEARQHPAQSDVMAHVMQAVQPRAPAKRHVWAMGGFALAAAITGLTLAPSLLSHQPVVEPAQTMNTAKLSPQMIEDLEMLSLLGTDTQKYGS
ncbi:MAG: hypothetical protein EOO68_13240 [Moraxellaceae bacterium]|nr:MAG: hypothetical protein EOO68_13240 [Moraxellaceae bacterium]